MQRDRLGQQPHPALGGIVGRQIVPADNAGDRGQIDDRAAARFQQRERVLAAEKRTVEVDRQNPPPRGIVGVLDAAEERDAGGVDEAVEATMRALDLRQHPVPVAFGRDVEGVIDAAVARQVGRDRDTALAFHRRGNGLTDGAGRARDQHDLVLETGHAGPR